MKNNGCNSCTSFYEGPFKSCDSCRERRRVWHNTKRSPESKIKKAIQTKESQKRNPERWEQQRKAYRARLKKLVYDAYGNKCQCCGETTPEFLTIDHVNNDGAAHRKELFGHSRRSSSEVIYIWAKRNGFPESLQILCFNCNCSRGLRGYCPHEREN